MQCFVLVMPCMVYSIAVAVLQPYDTCNFGEQIMVYQDGEVTEPTEDVV